MSQKIIWNRKRVAKGHRVCIKMLKELVKCFNEYYRPVIPKLTRKASVSVSFTNDC